MNKISKLYIFTKDTDATASLRGYQYQILMTLKIWLQNFQDGIPVSYTHLKILPHKMMSSEDFRSKMEPEFFRTAYQLACQLGLYYEDKGIYIPRFENNISEDEAHKYLEHWIHCYYAPNPFTKSLKELELSLIHI